MKLRNTLSWATALIIAPSLGVFGPNANAAIIGGTSGGVVTFFDLRVEETAVGANDLFGGLVGDSPPAYNLSSTAIDLTASHTDPLIDLIAQSGAGEIYANSDVDGSAGTRTVDAETLIANFSFGALSLPASSPLVTIGTDVELIGSRVSITGSGPFDLNIVGDSDLLGLTIAVAGAPLDLSLLIDGSGDAAPNTVLLPGVTGLAGLTITLNEQIAWGDSITTFGMRVSGIHLAFEDVDLGIIEMGLINGDVYIAAVAALVAIPEPSAGVILALTGLFFGFARRKRSK